MFTMLKMEKGSILPLNEDARWHLEHGAVYQVYKTEDGNTEKEKLVAMIWLTPMPENMCVIHYGVYPEIGRSIIKVGRYVCDWLMKHYFAVLGSIDTNNPKSLRLSQHMGFENLCKVTVAPGREKYLVILSQ